MHAHMCREMGSVDRAVACYLAALNVRPNFPQGLNNLAVVYTARGQSTDALRLLQAAIVVAPDYAEAWNNLGVLQVRGGHATCGTRGCRDPFFCRRVDGERMPPTRALHRPPFQTRPHMHHS